MDPHFLLRNKKARKKALQRYAKYVRVYQEKERKQLLHVLSHELFTPLQSITLQGYLSSKRERELFRTREEREAFSFPFLIFGSLDFFQLMEQG